MGLKLIAPPEIEPVSLGEAKAYLRVDTDLDEALINHLIAASRQAVEAYTNRCLIEQVWAFELNAGYATARSDDLYRSGDKGKGSGGIEIPRTPFLGFVNNPVFVKEEEQTEITDFRLDTHGAVARIHFGSQFLHSDGFIRMTFRAGYGDEADAVPAPLKQAILLLCASSYENRTGANDNTSQPVFMNESVIKLISPYRVMRLG